MKRRIVQIRHDTSQAAANLLHLAHSDFIKAQLFGVIDHVSDEEIDRSVENAVGIFMRMYAPPKT